MIRAHCFVASLLISQLAFLPIAEAGADREFAAGSLIIPMDLSYQDVGLLQAYGLVFHLLDQGVPVAWVIDEEKTWHHAPCDTAGDECAWDCAEEGSGEKCAYPTASPDFFVGAEILFDDLGERGGDAISRHGYRGGPFVIAAADADRARPIIEAFNDRDMWDTNPWAERTEFAVVSVHVASESFTGYVSKEMVAAPTIAVFSDGNENIATGYLRAAGIPQSNGAEFPEGKCDDPSQCGPGTANPDMLSVESIMGDMGTCDAPNLDHQNGALFKEDGTPAYCQIMSMHWGVNDRETVECDGGGCPDTQEECDGETFTYHGHEVVAEVRAFLSFPTHFFAECQAVNAYENTVPNPEWPWLDDEGRNGHFLTTTGEPPSCPCDGADDGYDYECVENACDDGTRDCCQARNDKERGAGFMIADRPDGGDLKVINAHVPYNQMDGAFGTVGGSEPAYNLSAFLDTRYKNDLDVTFITGPEGPGDQDVWMTGFVDGECDIVTYDEFRESREECALGKVSYLGGHRYSTDTPLTNNVDTQGTRLFLNALFEADCVTGGLDPRPRDPTVTLSFDGPRTIDQGSLPAEQEYSLRFTNVGEADAEGATLTVSLPEGLDPRAEDAIIDATSVTFDLGTLPAGSSGSRSFSLTHTEPGTITLMAVLTFEGDEARAAHLVAIVPDRDGDGVADDADPFPDDANLCGDSDGDECDDCASGTFDPATDCRAAMPPSEDGGCGCRTTKPSSASLLWLLLLGGLFVRVGRKNRLRP